MHCIPRHSHNCNSILLTLIVNLPLLSSHTNPSYTHNLPNTNSQPASQPANQPRGKFPKGKEKVYNKRNPRPGIPWTRNTPRLEPERK